MKRYMLLSLVLVMLAMCGTAIAVPVPTPPSPSGYQNFQMKQGWYQGQLAWYIATDTNDIRTAQTQNITLAPELTSANFGAGAASVFIVLNPPASQGPIFGDNAAPGGPDYTGVWRVRYVTWLPGATKVPLTSETQIFASATQVTTTSIRVNHHIMALGPLGGPWPELQTPTSYRIKQAISYNQYAKTIRLPFWNVFCDNPITRKVGVVRVIIPDAYPNLAIQLGANQAQALGAFPLSDTQTFWWMRVPRPVSQLPVIEDCPNFFSWRNTNFNYSPVMLYTELTRNIPPSTIVSNDTYLKQLLLSGGLTLYATFFINAPVVPTGP